MPRQSLEEALNALNSRYGSSGLSVNTPSQDFGNSDINSILKKLQQEDNKDEQEEQPQEEEQQTPMRKIDNPFEQLIANLSQGGKQLSEMTGFEKSQEEFNKNPNVGSFLGMVPGFVGSMFAMPYQMAADLPGEIEEWATGRPITEAQGDEMPDYELTPSQKAGAGLEALLTVPALVPSLSGPAKAAREGFGLAKGIVKGGETVGKDIAEMAWKDFVKNEGKEIAVQTGLGAVEGGLFGAAGGVRGGGGPQDLDWGQVGEGALSGAGMGALYGGAGSAFGSAFKGLRKGMNEVKSPQRDTADASSVSDKLNEYGTRKNQYTDTLDESINSPSQQFLDDVNSIDNERKDNLGQTGTIQSSDKLTGNQVSAPASLFIEPFWRDSDLAREKVLGKKADAQGQGGYGLNQYGRFDPTEGTPGHDNYVTLMDHITNKRIPEATKMIKDEIVLREQNGEEPLHLARKSSPPPTGNNDIIDVADVHNAHDKFIFSPEIPKTVKDDFDTDKESLTHNTQHASFYYSNIKDKVSQVPEYLDSAGIGMQVQLALASDPDFIIKNAANLGLTPEQARALTEAYSHTTTPSGNSTKAWMQDVGQFLQDMHDGTRTQTGQLWQAGKSVSNFIGNLSRLAYIDTDTLTKIKKNAKSSQDLQKIIDVIRTRYTQKGEPVDVNLVQRGTEAQRGEVGITDALYQLGIDSFTPYMRLASEEKYSMKMLSKIQQIDNFTETDVITWLKANMLYDIDVGADGIDVRPSYKNSVYQMAFQTWLARDGQRYFTKTDTGKLVFDIKNITEGKLVDVYKSLIDGYYKDLAKANNDTVRSFEKTKKIKDKKTNKIKEIKIREYDYLEQYKVLEDTEGYKNEKALARVFTKIITSNNIDVQVKAEDGSLFSLSDIIENPYWTKQHQTSFERTTNKFISDMQHGYKDNQYEMAKRFDTAKDDVASILQTWGNTVFRDWDPKEPYSFTKAFEKCKSEAEVTALQNDLQRFSRGLGTILGRDTRLHHDWRTIEDFINGNFKKAMRSKDKATIKDALDDAITSSIMQYEYRYEMGVANKAIDKIKDMTNKFNNGTSYRNNIAKQKEDILELKNAIEHLNDTLQDKAAESNYANPAWNNIYDMFSGLTSELDQQIANWNNEGNISNKNKLFASLLETYRGTFNYLNELTEISDNASYRDKITELLTTDVMDLDNVIMPSENLDDNIKLFNLSVLARPGENLSDLSVETEINMTRKFIGKDTDSQLFYIRDMKTQVNELETFKNDINFADIMLDIMRTNLSPKYDDKLISAFEFENTELASADAEKMGITPYTQAVGMMNSLMNRLPIDDEIDLNRISIRNTGGVIDNVIEENNGHLIYNMIIDPTFKWKFYQREGGYTEYDLATYFKERVHRELKLGVDGSITNQDLYDLMLNDPALGLAMGEKALTSVSHGVQDNAVVLTRSDKRLADMYKEYTNGTFDNVDNETRGERRVNTDIKAYLQNIISAHKIRGNCVQHDDSRAQSRSKVLSMLNKSVKYGDEILDKIGNAVLFDFYESKEQGKKITTRVDELRKDLYSTVYENVLQQISSAFTEKTKKIPLENIDTDFLQSILNQRKEDIAKEIELQNSRIKELEGDAKISAGKKFADTITLNNKIAFIQNTLTKNLNQSPSTIIDLAGTKKYGLTNQIGQRPEMTSSPEVWDQTLAKSNPEFAENGIKFQSINDHPQLYNFMESYAKHLSASKRLNKNTPEYNLNRKLLEQDIYNIVEYSNNALAEKLLANEMGTNNMNNITSDFITQGINDVENVIKHLETKFENDYNNPTATTKGRKFDFNNEHVKAYLSREISINNPEKYTISEEAKNAFSIQNAKNNAYVQKLENKLLRANDSLLIAKNAYIYQDAVPMGIFSHIKNPMFYETRDISGLKTLAEKKAALVSEFINGSLSKEDIQKLSTFSNQQIVDEYAGQISSDKQIATTRLGWLPTNSDTLLTLLDDMTDTTSEIKTTTNFGRMGVAHTDVMNAMVEYYKACKAKQTTSQQYVDFTTDTSQRTISTATPPDNLVETETIKLSEIDFDNDKANAQTMREVITEYNKKLKDEIQSTLLKYDIDAKGGMINQESHNLDPHSLSLLVRGVQLNLNDGTYIIIPQGLIGKALQSNDGFKFTYNDLQGNLQQLDWTQVKSIKVEMSEPRSAGVNVIRLASDAMAQPEFLNLTSSEKQDAFIVDYVNQKYFYEGQQIKPRTMSEVIDNTKAPSVTNKTVRNFVSDLPLTPDVLRNVRRIDGLENTDPEGLFQKEKIKNKDGKEIYKYKTNDFVRWTDNQFEKQYDENGNLYFSKYKDTKADSEQVQSFTNTIKEIADYLEIELDKEDFDKTLVPQLIIDPTQKKNTSITIGQTNSFKRILDAFNQLSVKDENGKTHNYAVKTIPDVNERTTKKIKLNSNQAILIRNKVSDSTLKWAINKAYQTKSKLIIEGSELNDKAIQIVEKQWKYDNMADTCWLNKPTGKDASNPIGMFIYGFDTINSKRLQQKDTSRNGLAKAPALIHTNNNGLWFNLIGVPFPGVDPDTGKILTFPRTPDGKQLGESQGEMTPEGQRKLNVMAEGHIKPEYIEIPDLIDYDRNRAELITSNDVLADIENNTQDYEIFQFDDDALTTKYNATLNFIFNHPHDFQVSNDNAIFYKKEAGTYLPSGDAVLGLVAIPSRGKGPTLLYPIIPERSNLNASRISIGLNNDGQSASSIKITREGLTNLYDLNQAMNGEFSLKTLFPDLAYKTYDRMGNTSYIQKDMKLALDGIEDADSDSSRLKIESALSSNNKIATIIYSHAASCAGATDNAKNTPVKFNIAEILKANYNLEHNVNKDYSPKNTYEINDRDLYRKFIQDVESGTITELSWNGKHLEQDGTIFLKDVIKQMFEDNTDPCDVLSSDGLLKREMHSLSVNNKYFINANNANTIYRTRELFDFMSPYSEAELAKAYNQDVKRDTYNFSYIDENGNTNELPIVLRATKSTFSDPITGEGTINTPSINYSSNMVTYARTGRGPLVPLIKYQIAKNYMTKSSNAIPLISETTKEDGTIDLKNLKKYRTVNQYSDRVSIPERRIAGLSTPRGEAFLENCQNIAQGYKTLLEFKHLVDGKEQIFSFRDQAELEKSGIYRYFQELARALNQRYGLKEGNTFKAENATDRELMLHYIMAEGSFTGANSNYYFTEPAIKVIVGRMVDKLQKQNLHVGYNITSSETLHNDNSFEVNGDRRISSPIYDHNILKASRDKGVEFDYDPHINAGKMEEILNNYQSTIDNKISGDDSLYNSNGKKQLLTDNVNYARYINNIPINKYMFHAAIPLSEIRDTRSKITQNFYRAYIKSDMMEELMKVQEANDTHLSELADSTKVIKITGDAVDNGISLIAKKNDSESFDNACNNVIKIEMANKLLSINMPLQNTVDKGICYNLQNLFCRMGVKGLTPIRAMKKIPDLVKDWSLIREALKDEEVKAYFRLRYKASNTQIRLNIKEAIAEGKKPTEILYALEHLEVKDEQGNVKKAQTNFNRVHGKICKWTTVEPLFEKTRNENAIFNLLKLIAQDDTYFDYFRQEVDNNGNRVSMIESDLATTLSKGEAYKTIYSLFEGTQDRFPGMRDKGDMAWNLALRGDMAQNMAGSVLYDEMAKNYKLLDVLQRTFGFTFFRASNSIKHRRMNWVLPTSTTNYVASKIMQSETFRDFITSMPKFKTLKEEAEWLEFKKKSQEAQMYMGLREALIMDTLHMTVPALALAIAGAPWFNPPQGPGANEDDYKEWNICGLQADTAWWIDDILGPALPLAAYWKSVFMGKPNFNIIMGGYSQSMANNIFFKVSDGVNMLLNPDVVMENLEDELNKFENSKMGKPENIFDVAVGKGSYFVLSTLGQFLNPAFFREIENTDEYLRSKTRVYKTDASGQRSKNSYDYGSTEKTDFLDSCVRKATANNPVLGFFADLVKKPPTGYMAHEMPYVEVMEPNQLNSMKYFSINDENGNAKSNQEKRKIALEIITILNQNDDMNALYKSGFYLSSDTRDFVADVLLDWYNSVMDEYNDMKNSGFLNYYTLGNGDYAAGQQIANEYFQAYNAQLEQIRSLYEDKLMSDELNQGLVMYNMANTTWAKDKDGNIYSSGARKNIANLFWPVTFRPTQNTTGLEGNFATLSKLSGQGLYDQNGNPMRGLIPANTENFKPTIKEWSKLYNNNYSGNYGKTYSGSRGGGGGGSYSIRSTTPSVNPRSANSPRAVNLGHGSYKYMRPGHETQGSRYAQKRDTI